MSYPHGSYPPDLQMAMNETLSRVKNRTGKTKDGNPNTNQGVSIKKELTANEKKRRLGICNC